MNNEGIKEILDDLRNKDCYVNNETILTFDEAKALLDYITNLKDQTLDLSNGITVLTNKIIDLQEENKKLRELDKNYPIEEQLEEALKYERIYKTRNEKAIEKLYCYGEIFDREILQQFQKEMLEILQGKSDE